MKYISRYGMLVVALVVGLTAQGAFAEDAGGEIHFESPVPGVSFSHKAHVEDMGFDCDSCHDGLFEMEAHAASAKGDFTMASLAAGKYCGSCHDGETAFASDGDCIACHGNGGGDVLFSQPVQSVLFSHEFHVAKAGLECASCHDGLFEMKSLASQNKANFNMKALYSGEYCGACHDGDTAFASNTRCASCHGGVKEYQRLQDHEAASAHH